MCGGGGDNDDCNNRITQLNLPCLRRLSLLQKRKLLLINLGLGPRLEFLKLGERSSIGRSSGCSGCLVKLGERSSLGRSCCRVLITVTRTMQEGHLLESTTTDCSPHQ